MRTWKRIRTFLLFWVMVLGLYFGVLYVALSTAAANGTDYGKRPPSQVFKTVLGYPPPTGVTNQRAEGKLSWLMGAGTVWITFDFTDAALAKILPPASSEPTTGEEAKEIIRKVCQPYSQQLVEQMRRVGWDEVASIPNPELYSLPSTRSYWTGWAGWFILDRNRRRAYIQAQN